MFYVVLEMRYELSRTFKRSSNGPRPIPRGMAPCVLTVVMRKIENFSHDHRQNTGERENFSDEKNPGWLMFTVKTQVKGKISRMRKIRDGSCPEE